jgi:hypothetical protein
MMTWTRAIDYRDPVSHRLNTSRDFCILRSLAASPGSSIRLPSQGHKTGQLVCLRQRRDAGLAAIKMPV